MEKMMKTSSWEIPRSPLIIPGQVNKDLGLRRQTVLEEDKNDLVPEHVENLVILVNWKQRITQDQRQND